MKALNASAKSLNSSINTLKEIADRADKSSAAITAGVPTIVKGLTDLKAGLLKAGAGLTTLQKLATSQEYGFAQMVIGATAQPGAFLQTPDIPDTAQQASTSQQFVAPAGAAAAPVTASYGVRGTEVEPTGPQAFCRTTVTNNTTGVTGTPTTDPIGAGAATTGFLPVATTSPFAAGFGQAGTDSATATTIPTVTVTTGDIYTVNLACIDTTPISETDPTN
ncbi:MAG TPA: hypothetical protein VEX39_06615 [Thermoleophilaceae bacterium]|nr:hypothetical protein [Thermoleophilaceae bacterium]